MVPAARFSQTCRNNIGIGITSITTPHQIPPQQRSAGRLFTGQAQTSAPRAHDNVHDNDHCGKIILHDLLITNIHIQSIKSV